MTINAFTLSAFGLPRRTAPRPDHMKQPDYDQQFDDDTLFYDIFWREEQLVFISPPLDDSVWLALLDHIVIDGLPIRRHDYTLHKSSKAHKLIVVMNELCSVTLFGVSVVSLERPCHLFGSGSKILYTKQRNNDLRWIYDWAAWHVEHHAVNGVVIYDNGSDLYSRHDIQDALAPLACPSVVIDMPFKFGPKAYNGSLWDSDYFEYGAVEHCRYAFCPRDAKLLVVDIDELVFSKGGKSVFDECHSGHGAVLFNGKWVDVGTAETGARISHRDHCLVDMASTCPAKWVSNLALIDDACFLQTHNVSGNTKKRVSSDTAYLHFRLISTHWKYRRTGTVQSPESMHQEICLDAYEDVCNLICDSPQEAIGKETSYISRLRRLFRGSR